MSFYSELKQFMNEYEEMKNGFSDLGTWVDVHDADNFHVIVNRIADFLSEHRYELDEFVRRRKTCYR